MDTRVAKKSWLTPEELPQLKTKMPQVKAKPHAGLPTTLIQDTFGPLRYQNLRKLKKVIEYLLKNVPYNE